MAESDEQDWAVFDKTTVHVTDSHDWFNSTKTEEESVCDIISSGNDEWQDFSSTGGFVSSHTDGKNKPMKDLNGGIIAIDDSRHNSLITDDVVTVIKDCFPSNSEDNTDNSIITHKLLSPNDESLLYDLQTTVISLTSFDWSRCLIKDQFLLSLIAMEQQTKDKQKVLEEADLSGFDEFDWSLPADQSELERQQSVESDSDRVRFSPDDEFQGLFRPLCSRVDTPIELDFDHDKAVLGLSMLPMSDLTMMRNEMSGKITKLSNELVSLLQSRDLLHLETVTKNRFIQAMLRVQESKHAMQNTAILTGSIGSLGESSTEEREQQSSSGEDTWHKLRSRSKSLQNISRNIFAKAKNLRSIEEDKATSDMLLRVVIPYKHDSLSSWSVPLLKKWTQILLAMAEKNPNVTSLVSEYLTSVIESDTNTTVKSDTNTVIKMTNDKTMANTD